MFVSPLQEGVIQEINPRVSHLEILKRGANSAKNKKQ